MREIQLLATLLLSLATTQDQVAAQGTSAKLFLADPQKDDVLGTSVAIWGDTAIVGAPGNNVAGTVTLYGRNIGGPGAWGEDRTIKGSDLCCTPDEYGLSVAASVDTFVVGTDDYATQGSVYIYERPSWSEVKLVSPGSATNPRFGCSVAIDGDTLLVGERTGGKISYNAYNGRAVFFERDAGGPGAWGKTKVVSSSNTPQAWDNFGVSVALWGDTAVIGADGWDNNGLPEAGAAFVRGRDVNGPGLWGKVKRLTPTSPSADSLFGTSVSIWADTVVVGAKKESSAGAASAGAAYVFERNLGGPDAWGERARLVASDPEPYDWFGTSVAIWGDRIAVGAPGAATDGGAVYVFERDAGGVDAWGEVRIHRGRDLAPGAGAVGSSVALSGDDLLAGDPGDDPDSIRRPHAMAYDPVADTTYITDLESDLLFELAAVIASSPDTAIPIGPTGFDEVEGLTFDTGTGTLYGADTATDQLLTIDPNTGQGTAIGTLGFGEVHSLAFSPTTDTLFGIDLATNQLITIDPNTGQGTAVGPTGVPDLESLAWEDTSQTLFAADLENNLPNVYSMNTSTGAAVFFKTVLFHNGPTYGQAPGTAPGKVQGVGATPGPPSFWREYDASSTLTNQMSIAPSTEDAGAAFVIEQPSFALSYCTAGTSASGCQALMTASGSASASANEGFVLTATGAEAQKNGLFFFGANGQQANPWGNGSSYQCVTPPVTRAALQAGSGTNGTCQGAFLQDLNALWCPTCPGASKNPGAGAVVQAQLWYRDPQNMSNQSTSLSDAVEFTISP